MEFVPTKLYYKIREVSEIAGVEAHVLRFWETEFPALTPPKSRNGQRTYRPKDIELILEIRKLLYDDGYTIAGARKRMGMSAPPPAPKKSASKKKPQSSAKASKPQQPVDPAHGIITDENDSDDWLDFDDDFLEEFNEDYLDDSGEDRASAASEFVELRELPPVPSVPSGSVRFYEKPAPAKAVTQQKPSAADKRPTSERLKRVQTELENILTLLDRE